MEGAINKSARVEEASEPLASPAWVRDSRVSDLHHRDEMFMTRGGEN